MSNPKMRDVSAMTTLIDKVAVHRGTPVADEREGYEKPPLSPHDGRVQRGKNRTVALNFRVTPELKIRFLEAAAADDTTMTKILEQAMDAYDAQKGK